MSIEKIVINEYGGFECICGNNPHSEGFYPCDETGTEMEPGADWKDIYVCDRCGRIINMFSTEVVGLRKMNKKQFWAIIDLARLPAKSQDGMCETLKKELRRYEADGVLQWGMIFDKYHNNAYKKKFWAAADIINGFCSDDGFTDFRSWLISQGKEVFLKALKDPDSLADIKPDYNWAYFEEFAYVASNVYNEKTGCDQSSFNYYEKREKESLPDDVITDIDSEIVYGSDMDFFELDNPEKLQNELPRLFSLYRQRKDGDSNGLE